MVITMQPFPLITVQTRYRFGGGRAVFCSSRGCVVMAWHRYEARLSPRPRHEVPPAVIFGLRPLFRYSVSRDAWVLRGVGTKHGPVLRRGLHHRRGTLGSKSPLPDAPLTGSAPARHAVLPSEPGVDSPGPPQRAGRTASKVIIKDRKIVTPRQQSAITPPVRSRTPRPPNTPQDLSAKNRAAKGRRPSPRRSQGR